MIWESTHTIKTPTICSDIVGVDSRYISKQLQSFVFVHSSLLGRQEDLNQIPGGQLIQVLVLSHWKSCNQGFESSYNQNIIHKRTTKDLLGNHWIPLAWIEYPLEFHTYMYCIHDKQLSLVSMLFYSVKTVGSGSGSSVWSFFNTCHSWLPFLSGSSNLLQTTGPHS